MINPTRKAVYIAGPMQGYEDFNFDAFFAAAKEWGDKGYLVGNPAQKDIDTHGDNVYKSSDGDISEAEDKGFCLRTALQWDLSWIATQATDIYMLRGWERSYGAKAEHALAVALKINIHYQEVSYD